MNLINKYLFSKTIKYIILNIFIVTILILFINIIEISRIIDGGKANLKTFAILSLLKIPSIILETMSFIIIISIAFMYKNLISNNEFISMRNIGYSIFDIFKPVSIAIFLIGVFSLLLLNPLSSKFEKKFNEITSKENSDIYSIKFINDGMWIKNILDNKNINFINISNIDLEKMTTTNIQILNIDKNQNKNQIIKSKSGFINDKIFILKDVIIYDINNDKYEIKDTYNFEINFNKENIIDSISNYKHIPYYQYKKHINNLKKFNLHSSQISLFYLSELLNPFFLVIIGFVVMGFTGKFKRNENFFKVLFVAVLIGFNIFLMKEIVLNLTSKINLNFIFAYFIIFIIPFIIGLYQMIKIEKD